MNKRRKITIPEPCQENWDKMTPKDNGRFCLSCTKTVVDFTKMSTEEIQHYFISYQNKSICGRFKNTQIDNVIIHIPSRVLYSQTQYHKMFLLALFIAMGTTLFSCQDQNGNKQKIDKVEVVPAEHKNYTTGIAITPANDSALTNTPNGTYAIIYNSSDLDILPVPKNGMKKFQKFFIKNYTAPSKTKIDPDKTTVVFVIEKDGSLTNFNIIKNTSIENGKEAIRVLEKGPKWLPGKFKNKIVRSTYTLSIPFEQ